MNDSRFKCFEDLKDIPGLPMTFYQRFMKVSCIGKDRLSPETKHNIIKAYRKAWG
jgi:hypothetical protein